MLCILTPTTNKQFVAQTALDAPWAGKCAGENNGSTIDSIVLAKVARGRSSPRTTKNADWFVAGDRRSLSTFKENISCHFFTTTIRK